MAVAVLSSLATLGAVALVLTLQRRWQQGQSVVGVTNEDSSSRSPASSYTRVGQSSTHGAADETDVEMVTFSPIQQPNNK